MPTQLKKDWKPDEEYFWGNNADKHQMTNYGSSRSWCEHQLPDFKMYFCKSLGGCGKSKANWNLTLWNWVKRNWQDVDKSRLYREPEKETKRLAQQVVNMPPDTEPVEVWAKRLAKDISIEPITQNLSNQQIADKLRDEIKI